MLLSIRHETVYRYDPPPQQLTLRLRLFAMDNAMQRVEAWSVRVNGAEAAPLVTNSFGDREALWRAPDPPERVEVAVEGRVETEDRAGMLGRWPAAPPGRLPALFAAHRARRRYRGVRRRSGRSERTACFRCSTT